MTTLDNTLEVSKDGLAYSITRDRFGRRFEGLLREDTEGWALTSTDDRDLMHRIGRRKDWIKALHDALAWIETMLAAED